MQLKNIIILFFFPAFAYSQSVTFYADTSRLRSFTGHNQKEFDRAMEFEWRINHRVLKFGSTLTDVDINKNGPDTILFRISDDREWDTLVTRIPANTVNRFNYNSCCHYFNAITEEGHIIKGSVNFKLTDADSKPGKYFCSIDSYGTFVKPPMEKTISAEWRSPMLPNAYNVEIKEVRTFNGKDCQNATLLKEDGSEDPEYNFKTIRQMMILHYLPLSSSPIEVLYNVESGKVVVR